MLQRISEEPWAFFGGILVWIPLALWIISLIQWMVLGEVDVLMGLAGIVLGILLGVLTLNPPDPRLSPVFFVAVLLTVLFFPVVRQALVKRALHKVDLEQFEKAYDQLSSKPGNASYELKLARILYDKGLPGHALAIAERVLANAPKQLFESENRMLAQWKVATRNVNLSQPVRCIECGMTSKQGLLYCEKCGAPFLLHYMKGKFIGGKVARRLIGAWAAAVAAVLGLPSAATTLPPNLAIPAMVAVVVLVVLILWFAFRSETAAA